MENVDLLQKIVEIAHANNMLLTEMWKCVGFSQKTYYAYLHGERPISKRMKFKMNRFIEKYTKSIDSL